MSELGEWNKSGTPRPPRISQGGEPPDHIMIELDELLGLTLSLGPDDVRVPIPIGPIPIGAAGVQARPLRGRCHDGSESFLVSGGNEHAAALRARVELLEDEGREKDKRIKEQAKAIKRLEKRFGVKLSDIKKERVTFLVDPTAAAGFLKSHHRLFVVAPETGDRSLLVTFEATQVRCPAVLETSPANGYEKDLVKVNGFPFFEARITSDAAKLADFCRHLVVRKKAAIISQKPRIYLPPQTLSPDGGLVLRIIIY